MKLNRTITEESTGNHTHAWRGAWNRPMYIDEDKIHPFEVARMTDHNVRGGDQKPMEPPMYEPMVLSI